MKKKLECYEMLLEDGNEVQLIALVNKPAIQVDFMTFSETPREGEVKMAANEELMVLTGPALIPNKMIYRRDPDGYEYEVFFSENTVRAIAEQYLLMSNQRNSNIEHMESIEDKVCLFESWLIEDPKRDKATALGFGLPKGTWMVSLKVLDKELWYETVKNGEVRGFSIEGNLAMRLPSPAVTEAMALAPDYDEQLRRVMDILKRVRS